MHTIGKPRMQYLMHRIVSLSLGQSLDLPFSVFFSFTPYFAYWNKNCLLIFVNSTYVTGFGSLWSSPDI